MKRARFISVAAREFLAEVAYYDEAKPGDGARFTAAVEHATARALAFPLAGSPSAAETRRMLVRDFPFLLVYRPERDGIVVFAVAHTSKRPNYWRPRVR